MMPLAILLGISAAIILVTAGYLLGAKRGLKARERLRKLAMHQAREQLRLRELAAQHSKGDADALVLRKDLVKMTKALLRQNDAVHRVLEPLNKRDAEVDSLRAIVEHALTPLTQREQLAYELSTVDTKSGDRSNLVLLLDQIAEKGQFWAVSLHDEQGLPLASSRNTKIVDRLTAISALVILVAERLGRDGGPTPLSLLVHDEENMATLCRIFRVGKQRLLLSAVATGSQLTPTSLDPALAKVDSVLSTND